MRIYMDEGKNTLKQVVCNQCGKALKVKNGKWTKSKRSGS